MTRYTFRFLFWLVIAHSRSPHGLSDLNSYATVPVLAGPAARPSCRRGFCELQGAHAIDESGGGPLLEAKGRATNATMFADIRPKWVVVVACTSRSP